MSAVEPLQELPPMLRDHVGPGAEPAAPADPGIDAVRARLAARGLLATRPAVVVPKEPRPEGPEPDGPDRAGGAERGGGTGGAGAGVAAAPPEEDRHWAVCEQDEWDVELPPAPTEVEIACPQCRDVYFNPLEATRFRCAACDRTWRWAICSGCDRLGLAVERQESWRCGCGASTRSWWRTATAGRDANHVVTRRRHDAVERERALVRAGVRKRRWKLIALAVWAAVAAVAVVIGVRMAEPSGAAGTRTACAHFDRLRAELASGSIGAAQLDRELEALQAESAGADKAVADAILELRGAGRPGSSRFLVARTAVADACTAATA